jgi:hypothetical protein
VQRRQLGKYCPHALLWFADHTLEAPFEKARRPFSVAEMRRAGDLFALASRSPIDVGRFRATVLMAPLSTRLDVSLEVPECPETVTAGSRFQARVRLTNGSTVTINSGQPIRSLYTRALRRAKRLRAAAGAATSAVRPAAETG